MKRKRRIFLVSFFISVITIFGAITLIICLNNINKATTQGEYLLFGANMKSIGTIEICVLNNNYFFNKNTIDSFFKQYDAVRLAIPAPARAVLFGLKEVSNAVFNWVYGFL